MDAEWQFNGGAPVVDIFRMGREEEVGGAWEISGAHEAVWIHQIFSGKFERLVFHYEVNYLKPLSFPREGEGHHKIAGTM